MMKRIAAPMVGGIVSSTILTLLVIPVLYALWRGWSMPTEVQPLLTSATPSLQEKEGIGISREAQR